MTLWIIEDLQQQQQQFEPLGVSVNSPSILGGKDQFS